MNSLFKILLLCLTATLGACASVSGGNVQKMYVQTQGHDGAPVNGADCVLTNEKGKWQLRSPGDTTIVRSNKPMEVKCDKAPLPQGVAVIESATRGAMYGNILIGGVVGAAIDHSSGAAYEYPPIVKVTMGQIVAIAAPNAAPAQAVAPTPGYLAAPVTASTNPVRAKSHSRPVPPASGYAVTNNADAVPVRREGKDRYLHYLTLPAPKAFAVYESGGWRFASDSADAMAIVLDTCAREGRKCWLYSVDDKVVWREDLKERVGRSDQLGSN